MNIRQLLGQLEASPAPTATKTAAAPAEDPIAAAVDAATAAVTKTAAEQPAAPAAGAPVAELLKVAEQVAAADNEGKIKLAKLMGAAFVDAMHQREQQWEKAAAETEKQAAADYQAGFDEGTELVAKVATFHFQAGYAAINTALAGK